MGRGGRMGVIAAVTGTALLLALLAPVPVSLADPIGEPIMKRCVGEPPRQTEDPMSPPCVGYFDGDNGGATWQGVSEDRVTVVVSVKAAEAISTRPLEQGPKAGTYIDLDRPPHGTETAQIRGLRALTRHFNERYQTYNRHVSVWVYVSGGMSPSSRRAEVQNHWERLRPFATLNLNDHYPAPYDSASARRNILVFSAERNTEEERFRALSPFVWAYHPTVEVEAEWFSAALCARVEGRPVSFSGEPSMHGTPRVYGFLSHQDPGQPALSTFYRLATQRLAACGIVPKVTVTYSRSGKLPQIVPDRTAHDNLSKLEEAGVTTVVWFKGYDSHHTRAATVRGWHPEWIVAGDGRHDSDEYGSMQDPTQWSNAMLVSSRQRLSPVTETACHQAHLEGTAGGPADDDRARNCSSQVDSFTGIRQLFTAIQLSGPMLTPTNVESGFRALLPHSAKDGFSAACFYPTGEHSCVSDATLAWWDPVPSLPLPNENRGCWRMVAGGQRYLPDEWPHRDIASDRSRADPCAGWTTDYELL